MAPRPHRGGPRSSANGEPNSLGQHFTRLNVHAQHSPHLRHNDTRKVWVSGIPATAVRDNGLQRNAISKSFLAKLTETSPESLSWMDPEGSTVELRWRLDPSTSHFPVCTDAFSVVDLSSDLSFTGDLEAEMRMAWHLETYGMIDGASTQDLPWAAPDASSAPVSEGPDAEGESLYRSERNTAGLLANLERHRCRISRSSVSGGVSETGTRKTITTTQRRAF